MTKPPPTMDIDLREIESLLKRTKSVRSEEDHATIKAILDLLSG